MGCSNEAKGARIAPDYGEYLYDITWCETNEAKQIVAMPLVAESEVSDQTVAGIVEDFQKLLVARAGVRLTIHEVWFDREEIPTPEAMANHLAQHVQAYCHTQCDDVYLLVVLEWDHDGNRVLRYFRLGANGRLPNGSKMARVRSWPTRPG